VDGKIHGKEFLKTPDRIRQSFKKYGFEVYRVRNERIKSAPFAVAPDIIQKYYEVVTPKIE
jgi:very-short-patch-repair endonuclease